MISKAQQAQLRGRLFRHLDGLVTAPTAYLLSEKGILNRINEEGTASLTKIRSEFQANEGYLNVGLRLLCSQGWLQQSLDNKKDTIDFSITEKGRVALQFIPMYRHAVELLKISEYYHPRKFEREPFLKLEEVFLKFKSAYESKNGEGLIEEVRQQILAHIEGIILGPTIVHLGMSGMFHKYFMETRFRADEFHQDPESFGRLLDIFVYFDWFLKDQNTYQFTEKGLFYARRASAYGVTVSYVPTLRKLDELIFGNVNLLRDLGKDGMEMHVDRAMNVWGSGGAHAAYFKVVDRIVEEIFNRPIEEQPRGILDMGCGNGAFLEHLFDVIENRTLRGQHLEEHPLILVGADYNKTALKITRANLVKADIWAKVIWGDIGQPQLLAKTLHDNYGLNLKDLLNVRTFLDHNRIWNPPENPRSDRNSVSTGAFAFRGSRLNNNLVEDSLLEHFKNWAPYVKEYGLLVIELHTVPPELVSQNLGRSPSTAYDGTHGYSDQYIVEIPVFMKILKEAGLNADPKFSKKFPDSDLATVSVNLFRA